MIENTAKAGAVNTNQKSSPMTLEQVAPELREVIQKMPNVPVSNGLVRWLIRKAMTALMRDQQYAGVHVEKRTLGDDIALRIYTPEIRLTNAALLWIHGGGMVIGSLIQDDAFCADTARNLGMVVVSTDYRLAPEFPFPAALDDCQAAWEWLQAAAPQRNIDQMRIAVGGQSAGGGLAASLAQRLHDAGGVQPAAVWLFCPMLDDRTAARRELDDIRHKIWNNRQNRTGWRAFLAAEPGAAHVPDYAVAARRKNLSGLPATWIGCGDIDLFYTEDVAYADRLRAAGVDCTLDSVAGAPHGFERIATTTLGRDYVARGWDWLRQKLVEPSAVNEG